MNVLEALKLIRDDRDATVRPIGALKSYYFRLGWMMFWTGKSAYIKSGIPLDHIIDSDGNPVEWEICSPDNPRKQ